MVRYSIFKLQTMKKKSLLLVITTILVSFLCAAVPAQSLFAYYMLREPADGSVYCPDHSYNGYSVGGFTFADSQNIRLPRGSWMREDEGLFDSLVGMEGLESIAIAHGDGIYRFRELELTFDNWDVYDVPNHGDFRCDDSYYEISIPRRYQDKTFSGASWKWRATDNSQPRIEFDIFYKGEENDW